MPEPDVLKGASPVLKGERGRNAPYLPDTMKTEMVYQEIFKTRKQASLAIFGHIQVWYNRKRSHSTLGFLTPLEFEKALINKKKAA
ncbi:transposase InsO family protein [Pedobacter sp. CG_S7]|uniref:IS3 family transposase n=1 Tax=Pedobacter sp. CG_S7 TaxID=3143930 RepID=UPI0033991446